MYIYIYMLNQQFETLRFGYVSTWWYRPWEAIMAFLHTAEMLGVAFLTGSVALFFRKQIHTP
jgi:hypothetical protein